MVDGVVVRVGHGWNDLPDGTRLYLRKDGSWSRSGQRPAKAEVAVGPAGNQGSAGGLSPIAPGHTLTVKHGAWSSRRVDPVAAELVETAISSVSWLADPTYRPAVTAWARAEARCQLLAEWLDSEGILDPATGEPRGALASAVQMEKLALSQRQRLGLDPASRSQLEATLTSAKQGQVALDEAIRRGQEALRARTGGDPEGQGAPQGAHGAIQGPPAIPEGECQGGSARGPQAEPGDGR